MKTRVRNTEEGGAMYVGPFIYGVYDDGELYDEFRYSAYGTLTSKGLGHCPVPE